MPSLVLVATTVGAIAYAAFMLVPMPELFMTLTIAVSSLFISGTVAILSSVVPSESVPPHLVATATSFSPACGEFVGGVVAPMLAGFLIGILGIGTVMPVLIVLPCIVIVGGIFLKETAPMVIAKKNA